MIYVYSCRWVSVYLWGRRLGMRLEHTRKYSSIVNVTVSRLDMRYSPFYRSHGIVEIYKGTSCGFPAEPHLGGRDRVKAQHAQRLVPMCCSDDGQRAVGKRPCSPPSLYGWPFPSLPQHVIYSVKFIISYTIPDVSKSTKSKIKREKYLTQKLLRENHLKDVTKNIGVIVEKMVEVVDNNLRPKVD